MRTPVTVAAFLAATAVAVTGCASTPAATAPTVTVTTAPSPDPSPSTVESSKHPYDVITEGGPTGPFPWDSPESTPTADTPALMQKSIFESLWDVQTPRYFSRADGHEEKNGTFKAEYQWRWTEDPYAESDEVCGYVLPSLTQIAAILPPTFPLNNDACEKAFSARDGYGMHWSYYVTGKNGNQALATVYAGKNDEHRNVVHVTFESAT